MFVEINAKLEILKTFDESLTKVKAMREPPESLTDNRTPPKKTDVTTSITHSI